MVGKANQHLFLKNYSVVFSDNGYDEQLLIR